MSKIASWIIAPAVGWVIGINAFAGELYLCVDENNETVTRMNSQGQCLEEQREVIFKNMEDEHISQLVPVASFAPNENCKGKGTRVDLGFDNDGDGNLDSEELISRKETCLIERAH